MSLSWDVWHSLTEDKCVLSVPKLKLNMIHRETAWSDQMIFFFTNVNYLEENKL